MFKAILLGSFLITSVCHADDSDKKLTECMKKCKDAECFRKCLPKKAKVYNPETGRWE